MLRSKKSRKSSYFNSNSSGFMICMINYPSLKLTLSSKGLRIRFLALALWCSSKQSLREWLPIISNHLFLIWKFWVDTNKMIEKQAAKSKIFFFFGSKSRPRRWYVSIRISYIKSICMFLYFLVSRTPLFSLIDCLAFYLIMNEWLMNKNQAGILGTIFSGWHGKDCLEISWIMQVADIEMTNLNNKKKIGSPFFHINKHFFFFHFPFFLLFLCLIFFFYYCSIYLHFNKQQQHMKVKIDKKTTAPISCPYKKQLESTHPYKFTKPYAFTYSQACSLLHAIELNQRKRLSKRCLGNIRKQRKYTSVILIRFCCLY